MTRSLAAIAALVLVAVGCAGATGPSAIGVAATPSPIPSVAASPRPSTYQATSIPVDLEFVWLGPARNIAALGGPQALSIIRFRSAKFDYIFGGHGEEALNSDVAVSAEGQVRLTSVNATGGCNAGDKGIYDWTTTADGAGLTMTRASEMCSPRADAVVGDWVRAACKDFGCLGKLAAGTHRTAFLEPLGDPEALSASWRMKYGQVSYTVPVGWANAVDDPNFYSLVPQDEYAKSVPDASRYPGIVVLPDVGAAAQDKACSPMVEPDVGATSDAIAARIARMPSLTVGGATPIKVAGWSGLTLDVAVADGWTDFCAGAGGVPVLRQGGEATEGAEGWDRRIAAGEHWRLMLLDVAAGRTMAVLIDDAGVTPFDDLVAAAMPIVMSFESNSTS